jgi:hypothetical protein
VQAFAAVTANGFAPRTRNLRSSWEPQPLPLGFLPQQISKGLSEIQSSPRSRRVCGQHLHLGPTDANASQRAQPAIAVRFASLYAF